MAMQIKTLICYKKTGRSESRAAGGTENWSWDRGRTEVREVILDHDSAATSRRDQSAFQPRPELLLLRYGDRCAHLQRGAIDGEGASGP